MNINDEELRPTPILSGKIAERFYRNVSSTSITPEKEKFLDKCAEAFRKITKR